ncbi:NADP-dependent oxidoreductase domain-containing protein [Xylariales sp. PMI_506]|nr:NADP-dependent oxidoreductase domain-containing protein [Xylariales sp. PMI_506]
MSQFGNLVTRPLGKNGPQVPRLGLGLMGTSGHYGLPMQNDERLALLDEAYKVGERFWDTADMYGDCEDFMGIWFAANPEKRKDIFLSSKFGIRMGSSGIIVNSSPEYCREAIEKSLARLQVSYIDLYFVHHLDKVTPIEKTMEALAELKRAGKIRHIGLSECSADTLRRACAIEQVACVQQEYNLATLDIEAPERRFLVTARELGVAIVAYSPLGRGLLTGQLAAPDDVKKSGDMRSHLPRFNGDNLVNNIAIVEKITEIAGAKGLSAPQLALAWLLVQGDDIFGIPGTTKAKRLKENLKALEVQLTADEQKEIRTLAIGIKGLRVPENYPGINPYGDTPPL